MAYTYLASELGSGALLADLPLTGVKWGRALNGSGQFTAKLQMLPPNPENARRNALFRAATDRKTKAIYVLRDGAPMAAYEIHERRKALGSHVIEIKGAELFSYFDGRIFGASGSAAARGQVVTVTGKWVAMARDIIAMASASIGLDLSGVVAPDTGPTAEYQSRFNEGKMIGEIIADLSGGEGDRGFDYRVDLVGEAPNFARRLIMAPIVGGDVGLIAKVPRPDGRGNVAEGSILEDARRANHVLVTGKGDAAVRPSAEATSTAFGPLTSAVVSYSEETDASVLQSRAVARRRAVENISIPELKMRSDDLDAQLGTFAPGDVGLVIVEAGADPWFPGGAKLTQRVIGFDVEVPDSGDGELVTFKFDDPVGEF